MPAARRVLATIAALASCAAPLAAQAQTDNPSAAPAALRSAPLTWRLGAENVRLPGNENMGLVGATALIGLNDQWFVGPAIYGAATGRRGGLFVLGGEAMWRTPGPAGSRIEAGLFIGGGGGAAAPVGGGLMLRPQIGWSWPVGPAWLGVSASRVSFPDGRFGSNQLGLTLSVDDRYAYVPAGQRAALGDGRSGLGFDRVWATVGQYRVNGGAHYRYGGLRADHWLSPGLYVGLEGAGAAQGGADGYAEMLASVGAEWPLFGTPGRAGGAARNTVGPLYVGVRAAAGLAGGGAVATGGGPLLKLAGTLRLDLPQDLVLGLEVGRTVAPDGQFRANQVQLSLGMVLDRPAAAGLSSADGDSARSDVHEWSAALSQFPGVAFRDGSRDSVQTVGLRLRRRLSPAIDEHVQLAGAAHFAAGGKAGAYGAGLIGLAVATPLQQPGLQWGAELLAGAAGGGGVQTRGGAVVQPMLRVGWAEGAQRFQVGVGRVKSWRSGGLDSNVVELSYGVAIGLPRR